MRQLMIHGRLFTAPGARLAARAGTPRVRLGFFHEIAGLLACATLAAVNTMQVVCCSQHVQCCAQPHGDLQHQLYFATAMRYTMTNAECISLSWS